VRDALQTPSAVLLESSANTEEAGQRSGKCQIMVWITQL